jgi:Arc/MetJ-type ribon-helix-helix transcriptional regulator
LVHHDGKLNIMKAAMVRTQVQFTEEQLEALRERAAREQVSVSELVRRAVEAWVGSEPSPSERRRRALEAAGRFASGDRDVARRHDDYLARAYRP